MWREARADRGQAQVEYLGLVLVLVGLVLALGALDLGPRMAEALAGSVCDIAGVDSCRADPVESSPAQRLRLVDRYMAGSLDEFLRYRRSGTRDPRLDWSTDECSAPLLGNAGLGYDFTDACLRHDFGYRNYRRLGLFRRTRGAVDRTFLRDMREHCDSRIVLVRPHCHQRALQYHAAVRMFGGRLRRYVE